MRASKIYPRYPVEYELLVTLPELLVLLYGMAHTSTGEAKDWIAKEHPMLSAVVDEINMTNRLYVELLQLLQQSSQPSPTQKG